jgi:predicted aspartyl protease
MTLKRYKPKGVSTMGLTRVAVTVRKFGSEESYTSTFLIDTGSHDSMVSASELKKLGIEPIRKEFYEMANGELNEFKLGAAEFEFLSVIVPVQVMFGPDDCEPIIGVIALETAGFVVDPVAERLRKFPARSLKALALKTVA